MGDRQVRPSAVNLCPFVVSVDPNLRPYSRLYSRYRADTAYFESNQT